MKAPLPPELLSAIDELRSHDTPRPSDEARLRAKLTALLGADTFDVPVPSGAVQGEVGSAGRGLARSRVLLGLVVGSVMMLHGIPSAPPDSDDAPSAAASASRPHPTFATPRWVTEREKVAPPAVPHEGPRALGVSPRVRPPNVVIPPAEKSIEAAVEERVAPSASDTSPSDDTLDEELRILTRARVALDAGNAARALAALDEHAQRFPRGLLTEERISQRVLALCAAGRSAEAAREAERFLRSYPTSPTATQVRNACGGSNVRR